MEDLWTILDVSLVSDSIRNPVSREWDENCSFLLCLCILTGLHAHAHLERMHTTHKHTQINDKLLATFQIFVLAIPLPM